MNRFSVSTLMLFLAALLVASCSTIKVDPNDPNAHLIQGVQHVQQGPMQCGAASMKMVLDYYDKDTSLNSIFNTVSVKGGLVTPSRLMAHYPSYHGLEAIPFVSDNPDLIRKFVVRDVPLIARGLWWGTGADCHYMVIVGYQKNGFIVDDPANGLKFMDFKAFADWHMCKHDPKWLLAIYPEEYSQDIPSPFSD